ncbi:hypothetical protein [Sphingobacterium endophyticum]|uniref:hypothetical protein n=1 Tax=Sphingobacterium endophyticum TaxID=2546448 RepID=UPI0018CD7A27|nr:hypothetical protein [Sphingobacterium endophyticum]
MMNYSAIGISSYLKPLLLLVLLLLGTRANGQRTITVVGSSWNVNPEPITEAGLNYIGTYESASDQLLLTARVPLLLTSGRVSVRYEPFPTWNNALNLSVRRTGNGTTTCLLCTINGGTAYQPITTTDTELFNIQAVLALAAFNNIPIQLRLNGVSVTLPTGNYQSRVIFTIGPN